MQLLLALAVLASLTAAVLAALAWRSAGRPPAGEQRLQLGVDGLRQNLQELTSATSGGLREASHGQQKALMDALSQIGALQSAAIEALRTSQNGELTALRSELQQTLAASRQEQTVALQRLQDSQDQRVAGLTASITDQQRAARRELTEAVSKLEKSNEAKLDAMRATVQEKLDATLGERLDASFKQVSQRLETVHQGLGEMQVLAQGVGSLQRTLTNVKTRGAWAELQLEALLTDLLTTQQYERQYRINPESTELVDFAIRLPGVEAGTPVWLGVDSKFPMDVYERLLTAWEAGDPEAIKAGTKALLDRVKSEAASISSKYVNPPHTTDFAVLYLPTEGLFAEVVRQPGLVHDLRHHHKVVVAGPTTLTALLGSLSMGFRTLAIQQRSSEVWTVLGQVKTEFEKSAGVWEKLGKQLETAKNTVDSAGQRHRAIERRLRRVESAPLEASVEAVLQAAGDDAADDVERGDGLVAATVPSPRRA